MKIDQTVEGHDDLLKVVDNLLSEAPCAPGACYDSTHARTR